jgi:hypothetical protein
LEVNTVVKASSGEHVIDIKVKLVFFCAGTDEIDLVSNGGNRGAAGLLVDESPTELGFSGFLSDGRVLVGDLELVIDAEVLLVYSVGK